MLPFTQADLDNLEFQPSGTRLTDERDIRAFVDLMANAYFCDGPDRRAERRIRITLPVVVERLDEHGQPLECPVRAVTRDLSASGIGLVCQDPVGTEFVAMQLVSPDGDSINVVAKVLRCQPLGYYYDVGCKFVERQDWLV